VGWGRRRGDRQGRNRASKYGGLCDKEPTNTPSPLETQFDQVVNELQLQQSYQELLYKPSSPFLQPHTTNIITYVNWENTIYRMYLWLLGR
jgi:hypothetical protein